jgi:hypothetical protein
MPNVRRLTRARGTCLACTVLGCGVIIALTAANRAPHADDTPPRARHAIVVNSPLGEISSEPGRVTLPDAIVQAGNDPRDNLITFDPEVFGRSGTTITLTTSLLVSQPRPGEDCIDGHAASGGLVLDVSACEDAGFIIAGQASLTLARLTVRGGGQRAILVKDGGTVYLNDVTITGASGPGVALFGEARAVLSRSRVADNRTHGVEVHGQASATLEQVEVHGNRQSGLAGFDQGRITAQDCHLRSNGDWNVVLTQEAVAELARCTLEEGRFANADVSGKARLNAKDSLIRNGDRFGVFGTGQAQIAIASSTLSEHRGRGVELQDRAVLELSNARIEANEDYGVILFGQSSIRARRVQITRNGAHGVSLRGQAEGEFEECTFAGNRYSGLGCLDAADGGSVRVSRSTFAQNGMRPIYRGPLHLDPFPPTPLRISRSQVLCRADPRATIELFVDRAGEATQFLRTVPANERGLFLVDCRELPDGWVMTATATVDGSTSEFNVVAGAASPPVLNALLGRTGTLSDDGGQVDHDMLLRRWKPGSRLVFHLPNPPSVPVERYGRLLMDCIDDWTGGAVEARIRVGNGANRSDDEVVIPIRYVDPTSPQLLGRGGVTFMKWDASGLFVEPMEILLATAGEPNDTCPRVMAHEIGHTLGLCHVRIGLLSRMQGSTPPTEAFVNDFSPIMTYYDVLALHVLYDPRNREGGTLRELVRNGVIPPAGAPGMVRTDERVLEPTFSPVAPAAPSSN